MRKLIDVLNARPRDRVIAAPGVYDMVSLRMAAAMGFDALYMTGYGTVASHLGLPDAGLASYAEMVGRVEAMTRMAEAPLIADGDTGYGGLLNVRHAVRGYERAGAAAIQLEDQEFPKKCGHTPDRRVIPVDEMVRKIEETTAVNEARMDMAMSNVDQQKIKIDDEAEKLQASELVKQFKIEMGLAAPQAAAPVGAEKTIAAKEPQRTS